MLFYLGKRLSKFCNTPLWVGKFLKTVTYQEVRNDDSSALLGEICGRASRAELFEGHARAADLRATMFGHATLPWADS